VTVRMHTTYTRKWYLPLAKWEIPILVTSKGLAFKWLTGLGNTACHPLCLFPHVPPQALELPVHPRASPPPDSRRVRQRATTLQPKAFQPQRRPPSTTCRCFLLHIQCSPDGRWTSTVEAQEDVFANEGRYSPSCAIPDPVSRMRRVRHPSC